MDEKQNPFSLYDFLGYLVPGAIFIYASIFSYVHAKGGSVGDFLTTNLSFQKGEIYIPLVLISYVAGHVLGFLSSALIERYSIWSLGYPSKYLLRHKFHGYYSVGENKCLRFIIRTVVFIVLAPVSILDFFIGKLGGFRELYAKPLDVLLVEIITGKYILLLAKNSGLKNPPKGASAENTDFFRFIYHYVLEHSPRHVAKMNNYIALYGFLRNLCLISVVSFWIMIWHRASASGVNIYEIVFFGIFAFILYMAFVKFYRRFTLEALMALTVIYES